MKVTHVTAKGFKGAAFAHALSGVTYVHGPNFRNKSSVVQAVQLALCGRLPNCPAKPGDVLDTYGDGQSLSVAVVLDGDKTVRRDYRRTAKGAKCEVEFVGVDAQTFRPPTELFSPGDFLLLSGPDRVRHLFGLVDVPPEFNYSKVVADLKNFKADPHTEDHEKAVDTFVELLRQAEFPAVSASGSDAFRQWLEQTAEAVREQVNFAVASARRMRETAVGVTELRDQGQSLAKAEQGLATAKRELDEANAEAVRLGERLAQARAEYARVQQQAKSAPDVAVLEEELATLSRIATDVPPKPDLEAARRTLADARKELDRLAQAASDAGAKVHNIEAVLKALRSTQVSFPLVPQLERPVADLQADVDRLRRARDDARCPTVAQMSAMAEKVEEWRASLSKYEAEQAGTRFKLDKLATEVAGLEQAPCCPTCHSSQEGWRTAVLDLWRRQENALALALQNFTDLATTARRELAATKDELAHADDKLKFVTVTDSQLAQAEFKLSQVKAELDGYEQRRRLAEAKEQERTAGIDRLTDELADAGPEYGEAKDRHAAFGDSTYKSAFEAERATYNAAEEHSKAVEVENARQKRVLELQGHLGGAATAAEAQARLKELESTGATLREQHQFATTAAQEKFKAHLSAQEAHRKAVQEAAAAAQVVKAGKEADRADAEAAVGKYLSKLLLDTRELCIAQAIGPFLSSCNDLCEGILKHPLALADGEFGMQGPRFVPWRSFSGSETALALAALGIGLAARSGLRMAVVDEMGRLDATHAGMLVKRVVELVEAGRLDQAVFVDVKPPPHRPTSPAFSTIEL